MQKNFPGDTLYGLQPTPSRAEILVVDILVWGVSLRETPKDTGDKEVDVVVDPQVRILVVLDHPRTPHRGSKQEVTIRKAL